MSMRSYPTIFSALVEVKPLPGCELDCEMIAGAFVRCHVPATDSDSAISRLTIDLAEQHFRLIHVEYCVDHDSVKWENPDDEEEMGLVAESRENSCVTYGAFHMWGHDAPDA